MSYTASDYGDYCPGSQKSHTQCGPHRGRCNDEPAHGSATLSRRSSPAGVSAEVIPADANVRTGKRAGDADRDRALDHLTYMHANGHLDEETFNARRVLAMKADSREALGNLVTDLPDMPFTAPVTPPDPWWQRERVRYPLHAAGAGIGVMVGFIPPIMVHNLGGINKFLHPVIDVAAIVLGVLIIVLNLIFAIDFGNRVEIRDRERKQVYVDARDAWRGTR